MRQYLLSVVAPAGAPPPADARAEFGRRLAGVNRELEEAGAWVFAGGLHPPASATVLRPRGDDVLVTDGPFAEGKEHLGGFTIVRAPDLDAAMAWGRKLVRATGLPIEVRPFRG